MRAIRSLERQGTPEEVQPERDWSCTKPSEYEGEHLFCSNLSD